MNRITKEQLEDLYLRQGLSGKRICKLLHISKGHFLRMTREYGIIKSPEQIVANAKILQVKPAPSKEQIIEDYLNSNFTIEQLCRKYSIGRNKVNRLLKEYQIKKSIQSIVETREETCLRKYGTKQASASDLVKAKIRAAYEDGEVMKKIIDTKIANGSYNTSKPEEQVYHMLVEKFGYIAVFRQHKTAEYPFPCDFYIKSLNLYIECQFTWAHGKRAFNKDSKEDQKLVLKWKSKGTEYFDYAAKIWTERDPLKRETAKKNNLNWKEFFTIDEFCEWVSQY